MSGVPRLVDRPDILLFDLETVENMNLWLTCKMKYCEGQKREKEAMQQKFKKHKTSSTRKKDYQEDQVHVHFPGV